MPLSAACPRVQETSHGTCYVSRSGASSPAILSSHYGDGAPSGCADARDASPSARPVSARRPACPATVSVARCPLVRALRPASIARSRSCFWRCYARCGVCRTKRRMTGCAPGRRWREPVGCHKGERACRCCSGSPRPMFTTRLSPAPAQTRRASLRAVASRGPAGCWLLGAEADRLDPHRARRAGRHPVESQAAEAAGWPAAHLDRRRVGQTHQYRALLRPDPGLLSPAAPTGLWLVGGRDADGAHLCRRLGDCSYRLVGWSARPHPLTRLVLAHVWEGVEV